jgi:hypothetical protein
MTSFKELIKLEYLDLRINYNQIKRLPGLGFNKISNNYVLNNLIF